MIGTGESQLANYFDKALDARPDVSMDDLCKHFLVKVRRFRMGYEGVTLDVHVGLQSEGAVRACYQMTAHFTPPGR